tara:strand:+ start:187 stop:363 length:177 start_codon:yes stop_codon:yes gene_type:complete
MKKLTKEENILAANPVLESADFAGDCKSWEDVRDFVEATFPHLDMMQQAEKIGEIMSR